MKNRIVIYDAQNEQWLSFQNPVRIVETRDVNEVASLLQQVEDIVNREELYAVGFLCYEAASAFDSALKTKSLNQSTLKSLPLLWFSLYKESAIIDLKSDEIKDDFSYFKSWEPSVSKEEYDSTISAIKDHIREGDTYQVNYTIRLCSQFAGNEWSFFKEIFQSQQANYSAFIDTEDFTICSASPELFLTYDNGKLVSKPMKGTAVRGLTNNQDKKQAKWLYNSEKNRAENLMIVDMIRNDFGRIAKTGSVKVSKLYNIEKYPTVWQMTSTVKAKTSASITDAMKALFPCASITGAPKVNTMKIISKLETTPRGIYTGTIGFISPGKKAQFNVAIRTVFVDKSSNTAEYGVGGGIVWDSTDKDEYDECKAKAKVLYERHPDFQLLESILWEPKNGYFLLDYHMKRIQNSAEYFDYDLNLEQIKKKMNSQAKKFSEKPHKIRLLVSKKGKATLQYSEIGNSEKTKKVILANTPIDSSDPFLYHKTTNRNLYQSFQKKYPEYDDVILWNEKMEITESCISNIVIKLNGDYYTPPVKCGLLGGTYREFLLDQRTIKEQIIHIDDLKKAEEIFLINSVRKWQKAKRINHKRHKLHKHIEEL